MRLSDYLRENGLTLAAFGEKVGRDKGTISRWLSGQSEPSFADIALVMKLTEGKVTAQDWIEAA